MKEEKPLHPILDWILFWIAMWTFFILFGLYAGSDKTLTTDQYNVSK